MARAFKIILMVLLAALPGDALAQRVFFNVDTASCVGDTLRVSVGYLLERSIVVENPPTSISHPQRTFLPDGKVCDSALGTCTYRSPITFSAFDLGTVISSPRDIDFVRINIEHSCIGDIFVALQCPNGQFASLFNSRQQHSACSDSLFDSLVGWDTTYRNVGFQYNLGVPFDSYAPNQCDSSLPGNRPGIGWNYCWSQVTSHQYAADDGLIYRYGNDHHTEYGEDGMLHDIIDSTHISTNTHYYHPQQSFAALVGCPVAGAWNIVVEDSWGADNGYLFDWELSFNRRMFVPPHITYVGFLADDAVSRLNDSTFSIPSSSTDSTVAYSLRVVLSSGDTIDTVFSVHWQAPFLESVTDTLCQGDTARWSSLRFTSDTLHHIRETTVYGCDSIVDLQYTFMPSYYLHDTVPFCANEPFIYDGIDYGGPATVIIPHLSQYGCDSTVAVHLMMIDSNFHVQLQISEDGIHWSSDTVLYGCRPFTVYLRDTALFEEWRLWDFGDGDTLRQELTYYQDPTPIIRTYDSVGSYTLSLTAASIHGCLDTAIFRKSAVRVFDMPEANFEWHPQELVSHAPKTQFFNTSRPLDSLTYLWYIPSGQGSIDTSSLVSPYYEWPINTTDQEVTLEATWRRVFPDGAELVCVDSITQTIVIVNDYLQFPNVVTPNGDGTNDRWEIVNLLECGLYSTNELWIYNSWGILVYHARDIRQAKDFWDPSGHPDGTYYFRFSARSEYGLIRRNGMIEVIR